MSKPKAWKAPRTKKARSRLAKRCGKAAFLKPGKLMFPVVADKSPNCKVSCDGLKAAYQRASQFSHASIRMKAKRLAKFYNCKWVR